MPKAIRFHEHGGPEVLRFEDFDPGKPAPDEAQVRHTAIGVNYIDVYDRTGLYPGELPSGLGREAAGVINDEIHTNPVRSTLIVLGVGYAYLHNKSRIAIRDSYVKMQGLGFSPRPASPSLLLVF